jgi:hypothetical protein
MKIVQPPNAPLIIFLLAAVISTVVKEGVVHNVAYIIFVLAATVWSYLEISDGANWVRRLMGLVVLLIVASSLYRELFF